MSDEAGGPTAVVRAARRGARRWLYAAETVGARYPAVAVPLARLGKRGEVVGSTTDILIESVPRCASSFAVAAFRLAQEPRSVRVAHHTHTPGHVIAAIRLHVPALVLIREPEDTVASNLIRHPERRVEDVLRAYVRFYEPLLRFRSGFVVGDFTEVVGNFGAVIRRVNERFGTEFAEFVNTPENVERCFGEIDDDWGRRWGRTERLERIVPRPSTLRDDMKDELRERYRGTTGGSRARAEGLYRSFAPSTAS